MGAIGNKPVTQGSLAAAYALEKLSKNTLIDLVLDRARCETGHADDAQEAELLTIIQGWLSPIAMARGIRAPGLAAEYNRYVVSSEKYRERQAAARTAREK